MTTVRLKTISGPPSNGANWLSVRSTSPSADKTTPWICRLRRDGSIDIETDGDTYHANRDKAAEDNRRNNNLTAAGWKVLRFNTEQIREQTEDYCIPEVTRTITKLGGVDDGFVPRRVDSRPDQPYQLGLFDDW